MIEMPVLFWDHLDYGDAIAYTNNVINSIVHGDTLLVAEVYGPNPGPDEKDIFDEYVHDAAQLAGFTTIERSPERLYHNGTGSIHCATNVFREIPDEFGNRWWDNLS